eukprot:595124-Pelagomonas_calceolata.AAC.7
MAGRRCALVWRVYGAHLFGRQKLCFSVAIGDCARICRVAGMVEHGKWQANVNSIADPLAPRLLPQQVAGGSCMRR